MPLLTDRAWKTKYTPEDGDVVAAFYVPALDCAVRYERTTGYFSASALAIAARGLEGLIRNGGRMRLIVGCTLEPPEVEAIERGQSLAETVEAAMLRAPFADLDAGAEAALELLAWMVARGILAVKVAVPCDGVRRPVAGAAVFHEKCGIIEDKTGSRLAFAGSTNETLQGWRFNWDSFHVFIDWNGTAAHVDAEEESFARLWADKASRAIVLDVPAAVKLELLRFLPEEDRLPQRLQADDAALDPAEDPPVEPEEPAVGAALPAHDLRRLVWGFIREAAAMPGGGERVGEATAAVVPWPHQVRAFRRMYDRWPPKLLIADEVGLGKTIEAGLLLRQAWLAGRARRILILAPKALLSQWQIELREKFNLNWPIYDGRSLNWAPSATLGPPSSRPVDRERWHQEPVVIASSQLMRRRDRARDLLESAEPWDLVVLDEAHHARRQGAGSASEKGPNQLLRLMQGLRKRTQGLVLLTATPMQVDPIEVWDLLNLLGLPPEWGPAPFRKFFELLGGGNPSQADFESLVQLFRAGEGAFGTVEPEEVARLVPEMSRFRVKRILKALHDPSAIPRRRLETEERRAALKIIHGTSPAGRLLSRHTRELLRAYHKAGKMDLRIADRKVEDKFVELSGDSERPIYDDVERYISATYNRADPDRKNAVGFVMTIYRRRLASSFYALAQTLEDRLRGLTHADEEDAAAEEATDEPMDADEIEAVKAEALAAEETPEIETLLARIRRLPPDSKVERLKTVLADLRRDGYPQVMIFTQYTDTMDFLREHLAAGFGATTMCFSGRGGEVMAADGTWSTVSRETIKRRFREQDAEYLLCTDAAAEGLNFQFCGALVNYDMPWNPMKVEQRIGRIDRLGQQHETIRIVNLHYSDTVEADVYAALRRRIGLFGTFVGKLQPILSKLPARITEAALAGGDPELARRAAVNEIEAEAAHAEAEGFDLDAIVPADLEEPVRPAALYDLAFLDGLLARPDLLPPGVEAKPLQGSPRQFSYTAPGLGTPVRVTTDPEVFDEHPESVELWSPGSPLFPQTEDVASAEEVAAARGRLSQVFQRLRG
ncbi:MAG: SNF2-related protein [Rhodospirillales bacterium]|nr:SNF2-related protein [Rhodospirillales bacterium]